jgi:tRNA (mo5U34)-methyltransferase
MVIGGVRTQPDHFLGDYPEVKFRHWREKIPADLTGYSVLDIGCNAGFFAQALKRRGASRVVGIDTDEGYLAQARFAAEVEGLDIDFIRMSVWQIASLQERFDIVLFMGVLYHLRHPLLALDLIHEHVAGDLLLFQSMLRGNGAVTPLEQDYPIKKTAMFARSGFPRLHFVEHSYSGDPTNWWIPNRACAEAMLRSSGFDILGQIEAEVFLCKRRAVAEPGAVYPARSEA